MLNGLTDMATIVELRALSIRKAWRLNSAGAAGLSVNPLMQKEESVNEIHFR